MKKNLTFVLLIALVAMLLFGCGSGLDSRSSSEIVKSSLSKTLAVDSAKSIANIHMEVELPNDLSAKVRAKNNKIGLYVLDSMKNLDINIESLSTFNPVRTKQTIEFKRGADGKGFSTDVYTNENRELIIKNPYANNYIKYDLDELIRYMGISNKLQYNNKLNYKKIAKTQEVVVDIYSKLLGDDIAEKSLEVVKLPDGERKLTVLTLDYSGDRLFEQLDLMVENLAGADIYNDIKKLLIIQGIDKNVLGSKKEFEAQIGLYKAMYDNQKERLMGLLKKYFIINDFKVQLAADENDIIVYSHYLVDCVLDFPSKNGKKDKYVIKIDANYMLSDVGNISEENIKLPPLSVVKKVSPNEFKNGFKETLDK